jgi:hypothetical protein
MMNLPQLPQPPTDNLYKFKAIAGISLLIVSLGVPAFLAYSSIIDVLDIRAKISVLEEEQNNLLEDLTRRNTDISAGKVESEQKAEDFRERIRRARLKNIEVKGENDKLIVRAILLFLLLVLSAFLSFASLAWIYRGFNDWQNKLQVYQDAIVKNQAKENIEDDANKSLIIKPDE